MADLSAIEVFLTVATGPSPVLDQAIMETFYRLERRHIGCSCWEGCCPDAKHIDDVWVDPATDKWVLQGWAFEFTRSMDCALALVAKALPGRVEEVVREAQDRTYLWLDAVPDFSQRLVFAVLQTLFAELREAARG